MTQDEYGDAAPCPPYYTAPKKKKIIHPMDTQVGGGHYKDYVIQPLEFITKNNIPFIEGNIIKYITRWKDKNGVEDLKKVIHYTQLLAQLEGLNLDG